MTAPDLSDDDLFEELDVYLNVENSENLYFLQYPTIPATSTLYGQMLSGEGRGKVQIKPKSSQLELDIRLDNAFSNQNFSIQRAMEFVTIEEAEKVQGKEYLNGLTFSSTEIQCQAIRPMMGVRQNGNGSN